MKPLVAILLAALVLSTAACDLAKRGGQPLPEKQAQLSGTELPLTYGNGVLYFACNEAVFGRSLSAYLASRPDQRVAAISGNDTGNYGSTLGYFVIVEKR
jgi:hypothetical protein